jgi:hypothetical protein
MACRVTRTLEWKVRLTDELHSWHDAVFLTLTYDDDHRPSNNSLVKKDLQDFHKRLRSYISPLKYYSVGEYGDTTFRPHYHGIYFGVPFKSERDPFFTDIWKKGFTYSGSVTPESIQYVTGYIRKKILGKQDSYKGLLPPFVIMSRSLGINYFETHRDRIVEGRTSHGDPVIVPRAYKKRFTESELDDLKDAAIVRHSDQAIAAMDDGFPRYETGFWKDANRREAENNWRYDKVNSRKSPKL